MEREPVRSQSGSGLTEFAQLSAGPYMRILVHHSKTRRFYDQAGQWAEHLHRARNFPSITQAEELVRCERLVDMEIVLYSEDPGCELTFLQVR